MERVSITENRPGAAGRARIEGISDGWRALKGLVAYAANKEAKPPRSYTRQEAVDK
jgi:hypothetical protein